MGLGGLLALAVLTRVALLPAALVILAAVEIELRLGCARRGARPSLRALAWVALPCVLGALVFVGVNGARFGTPFDSGYRLALEDGLFRGDPRPGLAGLLLSPGRGLIWMAPLVCLAPWGWRRMGRRGERLAVRVPLAVSVLTLALTAPLEGWHGAHTYGPRYLLPALPFLFLWVGQALPRVLESRPGRPLLAALAALGLWVQLPAALVDASTHQDLAMQAARVEFEVDPELGAADADELRFERTLWDWDYAAPMAHWRILRHRLAEGHDRFPASEIFGLASDRILTPSEAAPRGRGFDHWAWVDWHRRLGLPLWPVVLGLLSLVLWGTLRARRALDPRRAGGSV